LKIATGSRLGPYEVTGALGAGGMGEVWRARDPRLGRDVAIKVLPAALANDPERLARFERECRLLASLNHPHVASVLGLEDAGGAPALVMELVEGPTLAERIAKDGAIALPEALALARQVAEAVEYAHERGIVHRDLKPGNVKLTPEGAVKVLDFGLAKALALDEASPSSPQLTQSPTMSVGTQAGVLLGTAAYMAPEQARGKSVDRRADIWAFGVVLFEMLTGRQMFAGETVSDTIARILERQPDWGGLPTRTPARVRELLRRCLEKDPKQRLRDMGDARLELEAALAALASGKDESQETASTRAPAWWPAAASVALLAVLAGGWALRGALAPKQAGALSVSIAPPDNLVLNSMMFGEGKDEALFAAAMPRGAASNSARAIYRRSLDGFEWREVPGSRGLAGWDLSMDGHWLYALKPVAEGSRQIELVRMPVDGSAPPARVRPWDELFSGWEVLPDGSIAVIERGQRRFAVLAPGDAGAPKWRELKCERRLAELGMEATLPEGGGVLVKASYFGANGWTESVGVLELEEGRVVILEENAGAPRLMPGGTLLMTRGGTIMAAPWDAKRRRLAGRPVSVMQGLRTALAWDHAQLRTSPAGDLGFVLGGVTANRRTLAIVHPGGRVEPWNSEQRAFENRATVSPDGRLAAMVHVVPGSGMFEIVLLERGRPGTRRFATVAGEDCREPSFSPDGRWLAWTRQGTDSTSGLQLQPVAAGGPARELVAARSLSEIDEAHGWYPDGRSILVESFDKRFSSVRRVTLAGDTVTVHDVVREPFNTASPSLSPDGRRIAYVSDEGGEPEVVVAALGPDGRAGPPVRVSRGYGARPQWTDGGATLLWATRAKLVFGASVTAALDVGAAEQRFDLSELVAELDEYTALPGGGLLVTRKADGEGEIRRFDLVLGYAPELKRAMERATRGTP